MNEIGLARTRDPAFGGDAEFRHEFARGLDPLDHAVDAVRHMHHTEIDFGLAA